MERHHKRNLFFNLLANPFALAIPLAIAVILLLPDFGEKYLLELLEIRHVDKEKSKIDFVDLNGDGTDEHVSGFPNIAMGKAAIKVMRHDYVNYDQWNFNGKYTKLSDYFHVADMDKNGFSEIYTIYHRNDSLFLAAIAPYPDKKILFDDKLVTVFRYSDKELDYEVKSFYTSDLNQDGYMEFIFVVTAGFSLQPRMICAYDLKNNKLIKSKSFGASIAISKISDLNSDGYPEIYTNAYTRKNIPDTMGIPCSDYHSWLMVFDHQLRLKFEPKKHEGAFSSVMTYPVKGLFEDPAILTIFYHKTKNNLLLKKFSPNGKLVEEVDLKTIIRDISSYNPNLYQLNTGTGKNRVIIGTQNENLLFVDSKLKLSKIKATSNINDYLFSSDLNSDGRTEHIFMNENKGVKVFDKNLKSLAEYRLQLQNPKQYFYSVQVKSNHDRKNLLIKTDFRTYLLSYTKNPLFYYKYPAWILIYLLMAMVLWGAQYLRQRQVQRRIEMESTITRLQMKTIKNQMDPHFIFNVLNGIANNIHKNRNTESYNQIIRFSRLLRILMRRSETIEVTLKDELEFVLHYLELEKFRFKDHFEYFIDIEEDVDQQIKVPKMLIQLLVENSIKHGLREKTGLKKVHVKVLNSGRKLMIVVEDNGIGREAARAKNPEKGKGMSLLAELTKLNREIHDQEIRIKVVDLFDENNHPAGTRVEALVS